jgi:hypothetical protein
MTERLHRELCPQCGRAIYYRLFDLWIASLRRAERGVMDEVERVRRRWEASPKDDTCEKARRRRQIAKGMLRPGRWPNV